MGSINSNQSAYAINDIVNSKDTQHISVSVVSSRDIKKGRPIKAVLDRGAKSNCYSPLKYYEEVG